MSSSIKILFTGGGSPGHVTPNLALIAACQAKSYEVHYVGSYTGIERKMITQQSIPYHAIASGKLRRYFSWQNFIDPFRILYGLGQALLLCQRLKPQLIFSKGGFVAFPVVLAAWLSRIPVIAHESDLTPGLANRLSFPFVKRICVTFEAGKDFFKDSSKVMVTGTPIRTQLLDGNAEKGYKLCNFLQNKPTLMVMGGGLGAQAINGWVKLNLEYLCLHFNIIHLCGIGKEIFLQDNDFTYKQFDYVEEDLAHLLALADVVVSRAGANSIYELLALNKPHILVPLPLSVSRGDQIENARYFADKGYCLVVAQSALQEQLLPTLMKMHTSRKIYKERMLSADIRPAIPIIMSEIKHFLVHSHRC